jgi:hypothetical protein
VYHSDALGSVAAITDELQAAVRTHTHEAFGKLRATTGTGPLGAPVSPPLSLRQGVNSGIRVASV